VYRTDPLLLFEPYFQGKMAVVWGGGWGDSGNKLFERILNLVKKTTEDNGHMHLDFMRVVKSVIVNEKNSFSPFALYVDHNHLSPKGNKLVADQLEQMIYGR
jgi:hypothetical protein